MTAKIRPLVAGNWKMNGTSDSLDELLAIGRGFLGELEAEVEALVCVPATLLTRAHDVLSRTPVRVGGQDCHPKVSGPHTGDISAEMLKDAGASHVIVGHSERRADHGESDGLVAIICIGETRAEREAGATLDVLSRQIQGSVPRSATHETAIIAYEPVWAIGTGLTPTPEDVALAHAHIRRELAGRIGDEAARTRILYGGSVKPANARELLSVDNVNGALVGGASLNASDFLGIADAYRPG
jgi:triosephosphate isomerase